MRAVHAISIYLFLISIGFLKYGCARKQGMLLLFLRTYVSHNPEYFSQYDLIISPKAPGPELTVEVHVIRNFTFSPMMKIVILMQPANTKSFRNVVAFDFDFCDVVGTEDRVKNVFDVSVANVVNVWATNMKKYGNMLKCPVTVGHYSIKNLRADKKSVPSFFIPGKYRINITVYFKDTEPRIFSYNASIDIDLRRN